MNKHGSHLGHVTSIMLMNFHFLVQAYIQNLAENGPVVTDKTSLSFICKWPWPRSRNDLDRQYLYIFIDSISFRSQAAEKSTFLLLTTESLSYKF